MYTEKEKQFKHFEPFSAYLHFFIFFLFLNSWGEAALGSAQNSKGGLGTKRTTSRQAYISPWLTGPLLSAGYEAIPQGKFEIEPYLYEIVYTGFYNKNWRSISSPNFYQTILQVPFWAGITKRADINIMPQFYYNTTQGQSYSGWGDFSIGFDWQIIKDHPEKKWLPQLKFSITETFPTGKYQKLNPDKLLTDSIGLGSYSTTLTAVLGKIFHLRGVHYMSSILTVSDVISAPVHIKGLSVYRGGPATRGKVYPGNLLRIIYGTEFTLTKNWAFAIDITASFYAKTRFKGYSRQPAGFPSATQISLAPAIEYSWNFNLGLIMGSWFTIAGRNDYRFASAVCATTFYYSF